MTMTTKMNVAESTSESIQDYKFFEPTKRLRHYFLLEAISSEQQLSQRQLSRTAGISPSVTNQYLAQFEEDSLISRRSVNDRDFQYSLTEQGKRRRRELMVEYIRETLQLFSRGKKRLASVLRQHQQRLNCTEIIFYTAGEVTELLLHALDETDFTLLAIADDDSRKQGQEMYGFPVIAPENIPEYSPDAVMITTFRYREDIRNKINYLQQEGIEVTGL